MDFHDDRVIALKAWLTSQFGHADYTIEQASEDASFRRYFRIILDAQSYIAMDAPPEYEDCRPFVAIAALLEKHNLNVPYIHNQNLDLGFLLLKDLGSTPYLMQLSPSTANALYFDALNALYVLQVEVPFSDLPEYNATLLNSEMSLYVDWFLKKHLGLNLEPQAEEIIADTFYKLQESALEQPTVFVHRDYHSRNLMITEQNNPGILDFQDAVQGPVTYDLVSLLKDCYIDWPKTQVRDWVGQYYHRLQKNLLKDVSLAQFERWFDLMGMQRHLKAIGIFARLNHRDNKPDYIHDIPRTVKYLLDTCLIYPEFADFEKLMQQYQIRGLE